MLAAALAAESLNCAELRVVEVLVATITLLHRLSIRGVITLAFAYINLVLHMRWLYLAVSLQHYRLQFDRIYSTFNHHHPGVIILVPLASSKYQGWAWHYPISTHLYIKSPHPLIPASVGKLIIILSIELTLNGVVRGRTVEPIVIKCCK